MLMSCAASTANLQTSYAAYNGLKEELARISGTTTRAVRNQAEAKRLYISPKSIDAMDSRSITPERRAEEVNLTISPESSSDRCALSQHPPSTAGSLDSCSREEISSIQANPAAPPAWETKDEDSELCRGQGLGAGTMGDDAATSDNHAALFASSGLDCSPRSGAPEDTRFSAANLRLDLIPPARPPRLPAHVLAVVSAPAPGPGPSPAGLSGPEIADTYATTPHTRPRAFFAQEEIQQEGYTEAEAWFMQTPETPPSTRSAVQDIFQIDLGSPMPSPAAPAPIPAARDQEAEGIIRETDERSVIVSTNPAAHTAPRPSRDDIGMVRSFTLSPSACMPGFRGLQPPSPDSSSPQQDPWERLQQLLDGPRVSSPRQRESITSSVFEHRPPSGVGTALATSTGERKGFSPFPTRVSVPTFHPFSGHALKPVTSPQAPPFPTAPASTSRRPIGSAGDMPAGALSSIPPSPPMARHRSSFSTQAGESAASLYSAASDRGVVESGQVLIPRGGALGAGARETRRIEEASESLESESAAEQRGSIQDEDQKAKRISSELTLGVRAYAGERFMRAAEALSESPTLRHAADAAATIASAAAASARVRFEFTSKAVVKVLAASAKSFEEFLEEQLRKDGWAKVLRTEGCNDLLVPRGKALTQVFLVGSQCYLCWEFRVKFSPSAIVDKSRSIRNDAQDHNIGFALRRRIQAMGGSAEEDIFELKRYRSGETFQGRWTNEGNSTATVIMVWDNSYSCLRPKTVAYIAKVLEPGPDPTAPPPPPPPTPATHSEARAVGHGRLRHSERHRARDPDEIKESGRGAGFSTSSAITEGFAIEESEGEEPYSYNYEHHQHSMASGEEGHRYGGDESMSRTVTSTTHQSRRGLSGAFLRSFAEAESKELEEEKLEKHEEG